MDDLVQKITFMFGSVLIDKSMLAGVDDLVTLFNANSSGGPVKHLQLDWVDQLFHILV